MNGQDDILNQIKNGGFLKDFILDNERQKAYTSFAINSICNGFVDISDDERITKYLISCKEKIFVLCRQMLKFSDIIIKLSNITDEDEIPTEKVDVSKFLSEFAAECQAQLGGKCELNYIQGSDDVTETAKELLELCVVLYVRKAVANGAEGISFTNTSDLEYVIIHVEVTKLGMAFEQENMHETFTFDYADAIISEIIQKLNGKITSTDREMKFYIPLKNSGSIIFNSSFKTRGKSAFNIVKNMLSDFVDITNI